MELSKVQAILAITAIVIGWVFTVWKMWTELHVRLNAVGTRVNEAAARGDSHGLEIANIKLEQQRSLDDRNQLRERSAANMQAITAMREEYHDERITLITMIHNNDKASAERNAQLREQLARLDERLNIEHMVRIVVREHAKN